MRFVLRTILLGLPLAAGLALPAHAWQTPSTTPAQNTTASTVNVVGAAKPFFQITGKEIIAAVAQQLEAQGVEKKSEVIMAAGSPSVLYTSDHAIQLVLHGLQVDPNSKRWQAQAHFMVGGKTESVRPVAGTYAALVEVPVLTRQFNRTDVIEARDISTLAVQERLLRKDTVTDAKQLIGQSPRVGISPNRPIHASEISAPIAVKRGDLVEMSYNTPYMQIKATGAALEDGAVGQSIRVKNQKSQVAVGARVVAPGKVSVANSM